MRFINVTKLLGLLSCAAVSSCTLAGSRNEPAAASPGRQGAEIQLSQYGDFSPGTVGASLTFSPDGDLICLWRREIVIQGSNSSNNNFPEIWIVFSVKDGDLVAASPKQRWIEGSQTVYAVPPASKMDSTEQLTGNFPFLAPNMKWRTCFNNATAGAIQDGTRLALRAYPPRYEKYATRAEERRLAVPKVEMFRLDETQDVLWETTKLEHARYGTFERLAFLDSPDSSEKRILAACWGQNGYILKQETGEILSSFTYGHIETEREARRRMRRFAPLAEFRGGVPSDYAFRSRVFALAPSLRHLAAGGSNDRRLRVISLKDFSTVHESHANENPTWPWGGFWRMQELEFSLSGNYLIAESTHGGRLARGRRVIEVFDVKNWKVVQKFDGMDTHAIALSPDDTQIAYIQNNILKIAPFVPRR